MFESVLYFVLGFLCSALIALMVSPAIWHRAVILTKKRIESSVPLTLNEIQADKDQLRAEFAMSTRRLELSLQELRETTSNQVIELNRKRDELAKLSAESREKIQNVESLDAQLSELRNELTTRENELQNTTQTLLETEAKLEKSALELEQMRNKLGKAQSDADSSRIELVAKQTALDGRNANEEQLQSQLQEARSEIKKLEASLKNTGESKVSNNSKIAKLQKANADLELKLNDRDAQITKMRKSDARADDNSAGLLASLADEKAKTTELEAKLASSVLHMEALLEDASNPNVKKAMATLNQDRESLKADLTKSNNERDELKKEIQSLKQATDSSWDVERRENATLRERINDLAAQVTAMTAALEGPDSPINEILSKDEIASRKKSTKKSDNQVETLADRIRALQETARAHEA